MRSLSNVKKHLVHFCMTTIVVFSLILSSCTPQKQNEYLIAINAWPGYELLYLAKIKGFYEEEGLNIRLKEVNSLADSQRAFVSGKVDGFTSTLIETIQAHLTLGGGAKIAMIPDYSNGGDVIISRSSIATIAELKGKRVGCEVNSLGLMVIHRALEGAGLTIDDVELVNLEQLAATDAYLNNKIDAIVTYAPHSVKILKEEGSKVIFSTKDIPGEIIDVVTLKEEVIKADPDLITKLHRAWQKAYEFTSQYPDEAFSIMAQRQQIDIEEFKEIFLQDVHVFDAQEMKEKLRDRRSLTDSLKRSCKIITKLIDYKQDCSTVDNLVLQQL